jgi:DMSO reductase anchor subunit
LRNKDWTLVFFTTLSQLSVGLILCLSLLAYFDIDGQLVNEAGSNLKNALLLPLIFVGLATSISFFHLGTPKNAPRSLNNLAGSWISREILALGIYSGVLIVIFLGWDSWTIEISRYLLVLSSVSGLVFLWMMTRIYVISTIPAWNSWNTGLSFALTAICLGLITSLFLNNTGLLSIGDLMSRGFEFVLIVVLLIEIVAGYLHQSRLVEMNTGIDEIVFNKGTFYQIFLGRMLVLSVALLGMIVIFLSHVFTPGNGAHIWMSLVLVLVFAQEIMGRLLFYSSYFRIGV